MPEFGAVNITRHAAGSIHAAGYLPAWSGVRFMWEGEVLAFAGDETGRVMEIENPWATQQAAEDLLSQIQGDAYLPYEANDAVVDPAIEMGDAVYVSDEMSMVYSMSFVADDLFSCDLSAPADNEIDHEFPFSAPSNISRSDILHTIDEALDEGGSISDAIENAFENAVEDGGKVDTAVTERLEEALTDGGAVDEAIDGAIEDSVADGGAVSGYVNQITDPIRQDVSELLQQINYITQHYFRAEIVSSLPGSPESNVLYFVPE